MRKGRWVWWIVAGCVCGVGALISMRPKAEKIETVRVTRMDIVRTLEGSGVLQRAEQGLVVSALGGQVGRVWVREGERVEAGQPLFTLENPELTGQLEAANAQCEVLSSSLRRMETASGAVWAEGRRVFEDQLAAARAQTEALARQLSALTVRANRAGEILQLGVREGDWVPGGTGVLMGGETERVRALFSDREIEDIRIGQQAIATVGTKTVRARVIGIGRVAQDSGTGGALCDVELELLDAVGLPVGMRADVEIECERRDGVLALPLDVLSSDEGHVWLWEAGRIREAEIETGMQDDFYVEVMGLAEGDRVCAAPRED